MFCCYTDILKYSEENCKVYLFHAVQGALRAGDVLCLKRMERFSPKTLDNRTTLRAVIIYPASVPKGG